MELTRIFSALADDTRFAIVDRLLTEGELPAGDLVTQFDMSGPAISRHLKVLREAGVLLQRVDGTKRMYSVRPEMLRQISDWTTDHRAFWEARMDRLAEFLEDDIDNSETP